jgi:hypothetical protein
MRRFVCVVVLPLLVGACPSYDRYGRVAEQDGLIPADQFARYGTEQAQAVAIGRALGAAYTGGDLAARGVQVGQASEYARTLPDVVAVVADTQATLLTVTFRSGWRKAVLPINDGVAPNQTPGLPARK